MIIHIMLTDETSVPIVASKRWYWQQQHKLRGKIIKTETIFGLDDGVQKHSGIHFSMESGNLMQADNMEGKKMHLFLLATYTWNP